jgi:hypothetical protein
MRLKVYKSFRTISALLVLGCALFFLLNSFSQLQFVAYMDERVSEIKPQKEETAKSKNLDSVKLIASEALNNYELYYTKDIENNDDNNTRFSVSLLLLISLSVFFYSSYKARKLQEVI